MTTEEEITLKWGTLKGWRLQQGNIAATDLLRRYFDLSATISAATQNNTPEQKQILCDLIRQHKGTIYLDWAGEYITKEIAIDYIMNYGNNPE